MKYAVLITNYIAGLIILLGFLSLAGNTDSTSSSSTVIGIILFAPAILLSLIYAHSHKDK
jgi:Zn-dependent membrane protease YugP